jgi:hypothetical protein
MSRKKKISEYLQSKTNIGQLDHEITFIKPIIEQGTSGEDKITGWEEIDDEPDDNARRIEQGGSTQVQADRLTFSQQTTWQIRADRPALNIRMRLVYDTQVYEILNISPAGEGRNRFLNVVTNLLDNEYFT